MHVLCWQGVMNDLYVLPCGCVQIEKGCGKEKLSEEWQQFNDNLSEKRRQFDADLDDKMAAARKRLEELRS